MEKEMIEEMAKDLKKCLPNDWYWQKSVDSDTYFVAKHLIEDLDYRKISKDLMVVPKDVWEEHLVYYNKMFENIKQETRKETAEKIYKEYLCDILSLEAKEEFAKQFSVEVEE